MSSSRLPGKVIREVMGRPLLFYQVERLKKVDKIDKIIIATTKNKEDDPIVQFCEKQSVEYFRGSENDVLERCYHAALQCQSDTVLRFTADCPLIDPKAIETELEFFLNNKCDYVYLGLTFAEGICCDILSFRALETAYKNAMTKEDREHVTPYIHHHPELFKIICMENKTDDSKYRFVVDNSEDLEVVKAIIEALYKEGSPPFNSEDIKKFLDGRPDIFQKNKHIIRNEGFDVFKTIKYEKKINDK